MSRDKYAPQAERWTDEAYADPHRYLERRADLIVSLGPRLEPGDRVLDLACGDGGLGAYLAARGLDYAGLDLSPEMVAAARHRLGDRARIEQGDLNAYEPPEPVAATTCFRAVYYARDRLAFLRHVAGYTQRKLVFDLNPRQYRPEDVLRDLRTAGFGAVELQPFFVPQTRALPPPAGVVLSALEHSGPLARVILRARFTYVCAASRR